MYWLVPDSDSFFNTLALLYRVCNRLIPSQMQILTLLVFKKHKKEVLFFRTELQLSSWCAVKSYWAQPIVLSFFSFKQILLRCYTDISHSSTASRVVWGSGLPLTVLIRLTACSTFFQCTMDVFGGVNREHRRQDMPCSCGGTAQLSSTASGVNQSLMNMGLDFLRLLLASAQL